MTIPVDQSWQSVIGPKQTAPKQPGKRTSTIPDYVLWFTRDGIMDRLGAWWSEIGWNLERLRWEKNTGVHSIVAAFELFKSGPGMDRLAIVMRPTNEKATARGIRKFRETIANADRRYGQLRKKYEQQRDKLEDIQRAVYELSPEHIETLKADRERRQKGLREIRDRSKSRKSACRKLNETIRTAHAARVALLQARAKGIQIELDCLTKHEENEVKPLRDLDRRIAFATPEMRQTANDELTKHTAELNNRKEQYEAASRDLDAMRKKLWDQEAYFAQSELLKFVKSKRRAHTPENLAGAMAGLPHIGCWQSLDLCAKKSPSMAPHTNYQVFCIIKKSLKRASSTRPLEKCIRQTLTRLPKLKFEYLRSYLSKNWRALRLAIAQARKAKPERRAIPYVITRLFESNVKDMLGATGRMLARREQLTL